MEEALSLSHQLKTALSNTSVVVVICTTFLSFAITAFLFLGRNKKKNTVFRPNLSSYSLLQIDGRRVKATNDLAAFGSDNKCLIDAAFLCSLPSYGWSAIKELKDPSPLHTCESKVNMKVLGVLQQPLSINIQWSPGSRRSSVTIQDTVVVEDLPVPFHLSTNHPMVKPLLDGRDFDFNSGGPAPELFPERYRSHPYWTSNVHFIPLEALSRIRSTLR